MKLELRGHRERYTVEQSLMDLFPGERPVYEPIRPGDEDWAVVACREEEGRLLVTTDLCHHGQTASASHAAALSGTDYDREGQRRHAVGTCFFLAYRALTGDTPPWGMLTGVRPDKLVTEALQAGASPGEAAAMLEREYFVTPQRAALALETGTAAFEAAKRLGPRDIDVYIGVPFCPTRCAYCSFISTDVKRSLNLVGPYLDALCAEIIAAGEALAAAGKYVRTLYIGGGTPTTLSPEQLDRLMGQVSRSLDLSRCTEYTVEAGRPDTITAEKLAVLRARGATRVSVNPQTMEDNVLKAMGRAHTARQTLEAYALVQAAGFGEVNMDLIAGLPTDTVSGFRGTLDKVLELSPANITVHTLALKKGAALFQHRESLPTAEETGRMLELAWDALERAGYAPYYLYRQKYMSGSFENVGWCKPGTENGYNICMMEELHPVLALGAGGVTKLTDGAAELKRLCNPKYPAEYLERLDKVLEDKRRAGEYFGKDDTHV